MRLITALLFFVMPVAAMAGSPLKELSTGQDSHGWEAVGRLNIDGRKMCTGALIRNDLIVTAAHCLYDDKTGRRVNPQRIDFLAGLRQGRPIVVERVERAVIHPKYRHKENFIPLNVRNDIALLKLRHPIRNASIRPYRVATGAQRGDKVGIVSYARNRALTASVERDCKILSQQFSSFVMSCEVDFGASGAPVFRMRNGEPQIVSVVSAKAELGKLRVSLGVDIAKSIQFMLERMNAKPNGISRPELTDFSKTGADKGSKRPVVRRMLNPSQGGGAGAKFVRPKGTDK
ncbi:MAG: trypsin-like serine peptidase [Halocynthiibacter sp.]